MPQITVTFDFEAETYESLRIIFNDDIAAFQTYVQGMILERLKGYTSKAILKLCAGKSLLEIKEALEA